ncbi:SagB family peptide dehydrogenase [Allocoleopsis franciscana]|uniref:SagB-type dehydrogenase domain protein n=1 Tax=Allocoleopsis franciscana PCC 7113 TaxID=1173027 RepID=K9WB86_9CYAN|nr:SagB family peptide dehydrogenase [Allocoleopsis franciscana]AFZ16787.1 SagB-type dehydrogenase domain protein [Allocoleopsis franciscana PCC 7113]
MLLPLQLSFKKSINIIEDFNNTVIIQSPHIRGNIPPQSLNINQPSPGVLAAIQTLATDGATEEDLSDLVLQRDGVSQLPKFYYYLQKLIQLGTLCYSIVVEGLPLAKLVPLSLDGKIEFKKAVINKQYVLSRFAYCRKEHQHLVLESPLSQAQIILFGWKGAALISELAKPQLAHEICTKIPGISEEVTRLFFSLLLSTEMLFEVKEDGKTQEEESEPLRQWEFHNLLFHSRTRTGRHSNPIGRTYPFVEQIKPLPAVKPKMSKDTIDLYKPDISNLENTDYPLTFILERRKSLRNYSENEPITDKQLGEFLYRSARIKQIIKTENEEMSRRPYVNGGAAYEFELYILANTCQNIPTGFYHYCPQDHQLCKISGKNQYVAALLEDAWLANRDRSFPQVLIIISARFQRIAWTYESIAHTTLLKNVGALFQTMYLVATAMNLAPCALGNGNSDLFAAAAGTDYYAETSVGEFILGSKLLV